MANPMSPGDEKDMTRQEKLDNGLLWALNDTETGTCVFESSDPQEFVDRAAELEEEHKHRDPNGMGLAGVAAGTFSIEGDAVALGVVGHKVLDKNGKLRKIGRGKLRTPSHLPDQDW